MTMAMAIALILSGFTYSCHSSSPPALRGEEGPHARHGEVRWVRYAPTCTPSLGIHSSLPVRCARSFLCHAGEVTYERCVNTTARKDGEEGMSTIDGIGQSPRRREISASSPGTAPISTISDRGLAHAVVLRSPHGHARTTELSRSRLHRHAPGVLSYSTAADVDADGLKPFRPYGETNTQTAAVRFHPAALLATADKVRFVASPVALVVAETRAQVSTPPS